VALTLTFEQAGRVALEVPVRGMAAGAAQGGHGGHGEAGEPQTN
jgi:hypothetical protein